jgi:hypothetical protein
MAINRAEDVLDAIASRELPISHPERKSMLSRKSSPRKALLHCMHVRWYNKSHS